MKQRENFGSKLGIIMATAGSALGLGNIYRFPIEAGNNGGGAFLIVYLFVALLIGTPLMISEFIIGRRAKSNPVGAFRKLAGIRTAWPWVGWLGILCAFLILAFYTTVAGWTLGYLGKSVANHFADQDITQIQHQFDTFVTHPWLPIVCQLAFLALTAIVVARGVKDGIERWSKILMPLLLVIMVILCVKSLSLNGAAEGIKFLFKPDFSKITGSVLLSALGQSFFSLSIGMGALITYGSYIARTDNMVSSAVSVVLADTFVAIMAGIIIFPAAFSFGIQPQAGVIATLTSTISLLEVIVAALTEEFNFSRSKAAWAGAALTAVIGVIATLSFRTGSPLHIGGTIAFDLLDRVTSHYIMPIGGLLIVLFVGWRLKRADTLDELTNGGTLKAGIRQAILFIIRYLCPVAIAVIFVSQLLQ